MSNEPIETELGEEAETEFERKPVAGNKDVWLFLIVIDIVFLCVFGFFLYKNLSAKFMSPSSAPVKIALAEEENEMPVLSEVVTEEVVISARPAAEPAAVQPEPDTLSSVFPVPAQLEQPEVKPQAKPVTEAKPAAKPQPKAQEIKQSVIINPKSKGTYKRVTFRYFGDAKDVDIISGFTMSKPQSLQKKGDYWETTLSIAPGTYRFLYMVDGKQMLDPYSDEQKGRSIVVVQ